jgi:hypothetical protein
VQIVSNHEIVLFIEVIFGLSSNVTGAGIVKEATKKTKIYQCFPLYTMLLALGNPRYSILTVLPPLHNAPGPGQSQVQHFNSASPSTQCS